eukprot:m.279947 g.279947  ORF g.279947 m.279947 type:complete len:381 (-) comp16323_c11_seq86:228-1370(-)
MMLFVLCVSCLVSLATSSCTTDDDCQLNGICSANTCKCDDAWHGDQCELLTLQPGEYSYAPADATSWGGGPPVYDTERKKWVFYVTEIANHCGLSEWQHMSTVVEALGDAPAGPFTRNRLVVPTQAHNPYYVYDNSSGTHLIFHIGGGDNPPSKTNPFKTNCSGGTTPGPAQYTDAPLYSAQPYVHYSSSLSGNYTRLNITLPADAKPLSWGSDNPAPFIFPNGTVLMLTRKYNSTRAKHGPQPHDTIWLVRAPSFKGPYEFVFDHPVFVNESFNEEDPCIYQDQRGHFHALFHFTHGHAWSRDGINWSWGGGKAAWTSTVKESDGSLRTLKDSERPRVWVDPTTKLPSLLFIASGGDSQPTAVGKGEKGFNVVQKIGSH